MNRIEQTTLNMKDIDEHHYFLRKWACVILTLDVPLPKQYDDMLERFIHTFLGDY